ncbi:hypothetical protein D3C73_522050 [compost metagenome]
MGIKRVVLKHHGDIAIAGRQIGHFAVADEDLAFGGRLQTCQDLQHGRLTAAGGADQYNKLSIFDFQRKGSEHIQRAIRLADIAN